MLDRVAVVAIRTERPVDPQTPIPDQGVDLDKMGARILGRTSAALRAIGEPDQGVRGQDLVGLAEVVERDLGFRNLGQSRALGRRPEIAEKAKADPLVRNSPERLLDASDHRRRFCAGGADIQQDGIEAREPAHRAAQVDFGEQVFPAVPFQQEIQLGRTRAPRQGAWQCCNEKLKRARLVGARCVA